MTAPIQNNCTGAIATTATTATKPRSAAPTFTKLSEEQSTALFRLGVEPKRIHRNLVNAIQLYSLDDLNQAVNYTQWRVVDRTDLPPVPNLIGYFLTALKKRFLVPGLSIPVAEPTEPKLADLQQEWIDLAYAKGLAASQLKDGVFWIYLGDEAVLFEQALERYPIEQLRSGGAPVVPAHCPAPPPSVALLDQDDSLTNTDSLRTLMEVFAPRDANPQRDFELKLAWFQSRVDELGPDDRMLRCWDLFEFGRVVLSQQGSRWCLKRSG